MRQYKSKYKREGKASDIWNGRKTSKLHIGTLTDRLTEEGRKRRGRQAGSDDDTSLESDDNAPILYLSVCLSICVCLPVFHSVYVPSGSFLFVFLFYISTHPSLSLDPFSHVCQSDRTVEETFLHLSVALEEKTRAGKGK